MKRAAADCLANEMAKKLSTDPSCDVPRDDQVRPFTVDTLPAHHFYLGGETLVVISDYTGVPCVHIRKYKSSKEGELVPTKYGVTLPPYLWQTFADEMDMMSFFDPPCQPHESSIVENTFLLSTVYDENEFCVSMQRYFTRKDFTRQFLPSVCLLTKYQWERLLDWRDSITADVIAMKFGRTLRLSILSEIDHPSAFNSSDSDDYSEAEMCLSTSLIELLESQLMTGISEIFYCEGCIFNQ